MEGILVFSGTTEGRTLSDWLSSAGLDVHVRVATEYGADVMDKGKMEVDVGSCGGADGIAKEIGSKGIGLVIDATHPYASRITEHIRQACERTGTELIRVTRDGSAVEGDDIIVVGSVKEAVDYLCTTEGIILAATGSKEVEEYTRIPGFKDRVVARVLSTMDSMQKCVSLGFEGKSLICAQGPFSEESNYAALVQTGASFIVTKDSGTAGGFMDKVRAARRAGAKVVLIARPEDHGVGYDEAVSVLAERFKIEPPKASVRHGKRSVSLIGIGMGPGDLTQKALARVMAADVLVGAKRMVESVGPTGKEVLIEYRPKETMEYLDSHPELAHAAVLLSGDVGFYSGARKLLDAIDRDVYDVFVEPGISSVVYMCAKAGVPWQDACLTSSHGRSANLVNLVNTHEKVFTLLTATESVREMCRELVEYGLDDVTVHVGWSFGYPEESMASGKPSELADREFGDLCVALIMNPSPDTRNPIGIPDEDFVRGDAPMTKSEVRALSVAKLKLSPDSIVYDVGAGTGSVSVEMALTAYNGMVYAVEKEDVAADLIEVNKRKFKASNLQVVRGLAPEALSDLPAPTHAFIGGSSGNLEQIVQCLLEKNPDVRIVINSVTIETMAETMEVCRKLGLAEEDITNINVSRARKLGRYHLMTAQNPVYIAVVRKG